MTARSLTRQLLRAGENRPEGGVFDLAAGYPRLPLSKSLQRLFESSTAEALSIGASPPQAAAIRLDQVRRELTERCLQFLAPDTRNLIVHIAVTASVAVDRAIEAAILQGEEKGKRGTRFLFSSPSFDVPRLLCAEKRNTELVIAGSGQCAMDPSVGGFERALGDGGQNLHNVVFVSSPDNPTGYVWPESELKALSRLCRDRDATLIVDHSFFASGVQDEGATPAIWSADPAGEWIGLWDTGKTFGFQGEKLAFILSSALSVSASLTRSLEVVQFEVPARATLLFRELIASPEGNAEISRLRDTCRRNFAYLREKLPSRVEVLKPPASSLVLVDIERMGISDTEVQAALLAAGVSTVTGSAFYEGPGASHLIRLCLAREESYFRHAVDRMCPVLDAS